MMYELVVEKDGTNDVMYYDTLDNAFYSKDFQTYSIDNLPERGKHLQLRISLGLKCNYSCQYCSQQPIKHIEIRSTENIKNYVKALEAYIKEFFPNYYNETIDCSFWGGEPLVYFNDMERLTYELRSVFPSITLGTCTNGELYSKKIYDWCYANDFGLTLSYDGAGQFVRHKPDILDNPERLECIKDHTNSIIHPENHLSLEPVFHKYNPSVKQYINFMQDKLQHDKFIIAEGSYIRAYNENSFNLTLDEQALAKDLQDKIDIYFKENINAVFMPMVLNKVQAVLGHLYNPSKLYRCLAHRQKNYLHVDLEGNLWSCHNNTGQLYDSNGEPLHKGNIYDKTYRTLEFSRHAHKVDTVCNDCLMKWYCAGNCCLVSDDYMATNCLSGFYQNYFAFLVTVHMLTGGKLISYEPVNIIKE